jgi:F420-non-reducing hydrogenase large subunit
MLAAFIYEDHLLHFYYLGGPDFLLGPETPSPERNLFGVLKQLGREAGERVLRVRREVRDLTARLNGSALFPVTGLPGGLSKPLTPQDRDEAVRVSALALTLALDSLELFRQRVMGDPGLLDWFRSPLYTQTTYYLGLVDEQGQVNFYDGRLRVVDPDGREFSSFDPRRYGDHLDERTEPWTYTRLLYLKQVGWRGWRDGRDSGVYRVAPLGRLNAATGMATSRAQEEYERMMQTFGGRPVHHTLVYHWARLVEVVYAAERMRELAVDPEILDPRVRNLPTAEPREGIGVLEAPRGTLIHHYRTDERGIVQEVHLRVATQNNMAALCLAVDQAARGLIRGGAVSEEALNRIEIAYRAYDPCLACSTHCLMGGSAGLKGPPAG